MLLSRPIGDVPLRTDLGGAIREGGTRVTLDAVVTAVRSGATAEEIMRQFPALPLADIYSALAFYLHQTSEVDSYLRAREEDSAMLRGKIEACFDPRGIRARLLARRSTQR